MKRNKIKLIPIILFLMIIPTFFITEETTNFIKNITYKEPAEEADYQMEQIKLFAITLETENEYIENIKITPSTCKINIERVTRIIFMDGATKVGEKSAIYSEPIGELLTVTKPGHTFQMWTTESGETVNETTTNTATKDLILYANWQRLVSGLTVNPNGGTWNGSTGEQNYELIYEEEKEIPAPTRTGYTFVEWQVTGNESTIADETFKMGTEPSTLTAIWEANEHTLTIDPNSGLWNGTSTPTELTINYDSVTPIADPTRTGYTFVGWSVSNGTLSGGNFTLDYDGDVTLTANWVIRRYKYLVYHKKQSTDGSTYDIVPGDTILGEEDYGVTITPIVNNYIGFTSPSSQSLTINVDTDPPENNIVNYNYDRLRYRLTVNPNTGEWNGYTTSQNINLYYEQTYTVVPPTKEGYNFAGWEKPVDDSNLDDQIFTMGLTDTQLIATWEAENYVLTFNVNGGDALPSDTKQITYNSPYGTLPIPSNGGATFLGWFTDPIAGDEITASTTVTTIGARTVYAHWEFEFGHTETIEHVTLTPGTYLLETWGAQGGKSDHGTAGGKGGYSYGTLTIYSNTTLYIGVGGEGETAEGTGGTGVALVGGFNGGGNGAYTNNDSAGGGGATHIALRGGLLSDLEAYKSTVLIVAGGGGGAGCTGTYGGYGGGQNGGNGTGTSYGLGYGATQTAGGINGGASQNGSFGRGGDTGVAYAWPGSGGGGGYYGGGAGANETGGGGSGGGGSGFVSSTLIDAETMAGNLSFTSPTGTAETGHEDNGYARITRMS